MNRILQEVWAEPTGTWNKPLENSKPSPKALDVRVEGDITSSQFSSNILWGSSALKLITLVYILIKTAFFELKPLSFFFGAFCAEEGQDVLPQSSWLEGPSYGTTQTVLSLHFPHVPSLGSSVPWALPSVWGPSPASRDELRLKAQPQRKSKLRRGIESAKRQHIFTEASKWMTVQLRQPRAFA